MMKVGLHEELRMSFFCLDRAEPTQRKSILLNVKASQIVHTVQFVVN